MKKIWPLVAVAAFGLAACNGQDDQQQGYPQGPATGTSPGATTPATTTPGTTAPGTAQPGTVPGSPGAVGAGGDHGGTGTMQHDTIGQRGTGTAPGAAGTTRP